MVLLTRNQFLLIVLIFCTIVSCKKTEDILPEFTIDKPWENSQWAVYDTIPYQITLKTAKLIKQIKVQIVNTSQSPVTALEIFEITENSAVLNGQHVINNSQISSGMYYFRVTAIDYDNNSVNRFVRISIAEVPLKSEAIYVLSNPNNNQINVYRCDSFPEFEHKLTLNTDYSGSAISSENGYLYVCGRYTGPLAAYDLRYGHQLAWKEDALINPPFPWFEGVSYDGKYVVAGYTDYRVKGFHPGGATAFVFQLSEIWPRVFLRHYDAAQQKDFFIIGASHYMGITNRVSVHYDISYSNMQILDTFWEMKKMFSKNSNEVYMFGNQSGQAIMRIYALNQNNTYTLKTFPTGKLYDVVRVRPGIFIISHSDGLFMYNYSYNSLTPYGNFTGEGTLAYDETTDKILYAKNNTLQVIDFLTLSVEGSSNFADPIIQMHILYNK